MKAIQRLQFGLTLGLAVALGSGASILAQDKEKEPTKKEESKEDKSKGDKLWIVDFDEAKATAAKEGKDILMEFTGSDWCPPCKALKKAVFDVEAFQSEAPKHFVLLKLDNPSDKSKQTKEEIEQYKTLSKKFNVQGVPTIFIVDATGKPFAKQVGYGGQKAEDYTKGLVDKVAVRKKRDEFLAQAKTATGLDRAKLLGEALGGIDGELALDVYRDTIDEIIKLDSENKAGLKARYESLTQVQDVKKQIEEFKEEAEKPADVVKKIDSLIAEKKLTGPALQEALFAKGVQEYRDDREACRKTLEAAVAADPDTERGKEIKAIVERVFKAKTKEDQKE
jgi:thioredoxin-related protein